LEKSDQIRDCRALGRTHYSLGKKSLHEIVLIALISDKLELEKIVYKPILVISDGKEITLLNQQLQLTVEFETSF
jgi:hypothetical protein